MEGWKSECWLDLAKGGIPLIDLESPRFPFHVFWKILIPHAFSLIDKTDRKEFSARVFFHSRSLIFFRFGEIILPESVSGSLGLFLS